MRSKILLAAIIILIISLYACNTAPDIATVTRVIDGDTIEIGTGQRVRYIGIDTPEVYPVTEACGIEARETNRRLVEGKKVRLERDVSDTDKYGRLLRYVYVDDLLVNAELVRLGLARARAYPPDTRHQGLFEQLEKEAREAGLGIWAK
jgi:micrococcal nuclease